ncbi:MAG TPA: DUF6542 domain-containing protein [Trebonia sp.]
MIGRLPVKGALVIFFGIAVLGAIATLATNNDPGGLLGNLIVLGAVIAALGIRRQRMYVLIPLPALTYLVLAILTGAIHDNGTDTSTTQLGLNFLQWIGNGFFSLCAGTILVLLIFGARLLASRQLVSGSFPMSAQHPAAGRSARSALSSDGPPDTPGGRTDPRRDDRRRTNRAPWDDPDPWYDQGPRNREPWTDRDRREDRNSRGSRDDRGSRDGWDGGDSRPDRRAGNRSGDDWGRDDRRPGPRNVPPGRGEPSTRALPPGRESRPGQDSREDRDYRGGGGSRNGRDSRDSRDSRGGTSRSGRGSWDERDPRGR